MRPLSPWVGVADAVLDRASRMVGMLAAVTPKDGREERERLVSAFVRKEPSAPSWSYSPRDVSAVRRALDALGVELDREARCDLGACYRARVSELKLEAEIAEAAGTARIADLGARRFGPVSEADAEHAARLAKAWLDEGEEGDEGDEEKVTSDGREPGSLFSRMRAEVGRMRLPFTVVVHDGLTALAATGADAILVAGGRRVTPADVARTVLHEVHGHALPRARARPLIPRIFSFGTARGADDQEGYALVLEERGGHLTGARKRRLAARHVAVSTMRMGASFIECVSMLINIYGFDASDAVLIGERAYRGGDGADAGIGREATYLEGYVRVRALIASEKQAEAVIASGQVAAGAVAVLAPWLALANAP